MSRNEDSPFPQGLCDLTVLAPLHRSSLPLLIAHPALLQTRPAHDGGSPILSLSSAFPWKQNGVGTSGERVRVLND